MTIRELQFKLAELDPAETIELNGPFRSIRDVIPDQGIKLQTSKTHKLIHNFVKVISPEFE